MQIGRKVGLAVSARVRPQVTFQEGPAVAVQTGRRIDGKTRRPTPDTISLKVTPGTVLGTVPPLIRGVSISACFPRAFPLMCGVSWSQGSSLKERADSTTICALRIAQLYEDPCHWPRRQRVRPASALRRGSQPYFVLGFRAVVLPISDCRVTDAYLLMLADEFRMPKSGGRKANCRVTISEFGVPVCGRCPFRLSRKTPGPACWARAEVLSVNQLTRRLCNYAPSHAASQAIPVRAENATERGG
jgi:hypothetical protein